MNPPNHPREPGELVRRRFKTKDSSVRVSRSSQVTWETLFHVSLGTAASSSGSLKSRRTRGKRRPSVC